DLSVVAALLPLLKTSAPASSCFFQPWMRVGWTPNWLASSLTVWSLLWAARATWALNAAGCCFRLPALVSPFLGHQTRCPFFKSLASQAGRRLYGRGGYKVRCHSIGRGLLQARPCRCWRRVWQKGVARTNGSPV